MLGDRAPRIRRAASDGRPDGRETENSRRGRPGFARPPTRSVPPRMRSTPSARPASERSDDRLRCRTHHFQVGRPAAPADRLHERLHRRGRHADVLESDVPDPEVARRVDDRFGVLDRPVVAGQHEDEVHGRPPEALGVRTPSPFDVGTVTRQLVTAISGARRLPSRGNDSCGRRSVRAGSRRWIAARRRFRVRRARCRPSSRWPALPARVSTPHRKARREPPGSR